ncbi:MAG: SLBB domain-containing protein [Candidatus Daviesbacteria bacterium]|nr:SLBB domain-containing protein [Candidatus Daviesbacteria bacterium]
MQEEGNRLNQFVNQNKIPLGLGIVGLVLLIGGVISSGIIPKTFIKSTKTPVSAQVYQGASVILAQIKVDVSGEVNNPGVYDLPRDARIEDAIKSAGGVTESADQRYMSKTINLAQKVSDGMKIYIPKIIETGTEAGTSGVVNSSYATSGSVPDVAGTETYLVNVNTASLSELQEKLPKVGVGPVTAQKIIDNRPYSGIEDLLTKKSVTRATYDKIKEKVTTW